MFTDVCCCCILCCSLFAAANVVLGPFVEGVVIVCRSEKNQHLNINMDEEESKDEDRSWRGDAAST